MKSLRLFSYGVFLTVAVMVIGCNKDIDETEDLTPLKPADIDADAGTWALITNSPMTTINQVALVAPTDIASDAYKAELATIKDLQSKLTDDQRKIIEFWSGGGVLRWNQFVRDLTAKYSLPPAPRDDGSYVFPDAENPFTDPVFPFANPPYAARAYAYISVAQLEALKSAWYYKDQYKRQAPYTVDNGVQALVPKTDLFAYPSEDAVMSGVTAELLKVLYPSSIEAITKFAADQRNAALWSGKASVSDISAGLAFGKSVATIFLTRVRGDGMGGAVGTKAQWEALDDSAKVHFTKAGIDGTNEILWKSLDSPVRPPMLPFFGKVAGWLISPAEFASERPGPPPSSSSEQMKEELATVKRYADNLTREQLAIVHKWADGAGTYTPPGHWNDIAAEYIRDANFSEVRAARAFALLNMALHNAGVGCWDTKYYWFNPRPSQLDPSIKTATGLPNFPSYTSGHSTFSASAAEILAYLFPANAAEFNSMMEEASISRLYGGIHYESDIEIGKDHGKALAQYVRNFAENDGADN